MLPDWRKSCAATKGLLLFELGRLVVSSVLYCRTFARLCSSNIESNSYILIDVVVGDIGREEEDRSG